jgi:hypothetical protein
MKPRNRDLIDEPFDYFLAEDDPFTVTPETTWECKVDGRMIHSLSEPIHATGIDGLPVTAQGISGTQSYAITVEIETDFEMYSIPGGSNATTVTNYITNLSGAVSTIYNRDLKTNVVQSAVHVYTTSSDPWAATAPLLGLYELGDYYHSSTSRTTSEVVFMSGKNIGAGIAWEGVVCGSDFMQDGHFGGPYAWCAGIGNLGTSTFGSIPDVNTAPYTMPTGTQNFWPLMEYAHEMGHNLGGHHTHCVQISDAERIASGFTDGSPANSTSNQVDHCFAHEGLAGCFAGTTDYVSGSQTTFKGTLMGYCHNVPTQATNSRYTFGQPVEGSHNELDNYMLRAGGPLNGTGTEGYDGGSLNIVNGVGAFTISAIGGASSVPGNSTGNTANITATPSAGATYAWTITNGTITAGQGTNTITYTAGASGTVGLRATAYNTQLCGVTDTKSVAITSASFNPPTNVTATATGSTTVSVTWTAATGTPPGRYNVYRSADGINYGASIGNTITTAFNDMTASANTSYLYKVRSADAGGGNESTDSNRDVATTVIYTNPTLTAGSSVIQRIDVIELRFAIDKVRALNGIGAGFYATDSTITVGVTTVKKAHIDEMRTNLATPLNNMGLPLPTYSHPTLTAGVTLITAADFNELRAAMR